jgi:hypothetical protein
MPKRRTVERALAAKHAGKSVSTQAGEFVREEIRTIRRGKHGARSPQQAIAIGLSEARRAGVDLPPPKGKVKKAAKKTTQKSAAYAYEAGQGKRPPKRRPRVARAVSKTLKKEPRSTVSRQALSRHAKAAAQTRKRRTASKAARRSGTQG